jgi:ribonuclease T1
MALVLASVLVLALAGSLLAVLDEGTTAPTTTSTAPPPVALGPTPQVSDLPPILVADLPREAVETLALIFEGGPFPYPQDGSTFENREGLLPEQARGYYQEFTVPTPGEDDRGPRRIVVGREGESFYTDDHYASFTEVVSATG